MYQPLEQFEQYFVFGVFFKQIDLISITNTLFVVGIIFGWGVLLSLCCLTTYSILNTKITGLVYELFLYLAGAFKNMNKLNIITRDSFCWLLVLVFLIFFQNIFGLIPYFFCNTSQLIIALSYSSSVMVGFTIVGIMLYKKAFINLFLPKNIPLMLKPFLFVLELISYISRVLSLAIRLFANMLAGHALLHILTHATWVGWSLNRNVWLDFLFFVPIIIISLIICLEILIAFLQTYVFFTLSSIYLNDVFTILQH